jgi:hypothetical protein
MERLLCGAAFAAMIFVAGQTVLATNFDESVNGNLSTNQAAPTALALTAGDNFVSGNVNGTAGNSQDWVAITVPTGFDLSSYTLTSYTSADSQGFTGFQIGSSFVGSTLSPLSYAGYAHYGTGATNPTIPASVVGTDLLPLMANPAVAAGATGFTDPLGPGTYTFLIQQLGGSTSYEFDFGVTAAATPEPASLGILGVAGMGLLMRRRRA